VQWEVGLFWAYPDCAWDGAPRCMIRDRDQIYGTVVTRRLRAMGIRDKPGYPEFHWVIAALVIVTILTIQGTGILLPTNLRLYFELQKPNPNSAKIGRWMRWFVGVVAIQGTMQVAIFVVMAKFATGL
jgi:hypothetical protein